MADRGPVRAQAEDRRAGAELRMSYLLFLDESGHDRRNCPFEVRGGVALHADQLWPFVQGMKRLEESCYGTQLHRHGTEIKGHKLLDKDRYRWAEQGPPLDDEARRKHSLAFLNKSRQGQELSRIEFTAYGQASLAMARGIFTLLRGHRATLFAAAIPARVQVPGTFEAAEFLRKDQVFLLERFFYFLERENVPGLLVMDETNKNDDRLFVRKLERYFLRTETGRHRTARIVPSPFFVSSDMAYPIQAADVCIYCVNWGFRIPHGMNGETREEIRSEFEPWMNDLQYRGDVRGRDGQAHHIHGVVYVPDPYVNR